MTQNHGDGMIYWHWNTSTQLKVMHTAQNYKQKGEANIIYFQVKTLTWWLLQIWEISTWNNWTERALLTGTFICVGTKAVLGGGGEAGRKKDCNRNRKQEHGRKKKFFRSKRAWKLLVLLKLDINSKRSGHGSIHSASPGCRLCDLH